MSNLLKQHKHEILDKPLILKEVLDETMQREFTNMLYVCLFAPFIHPETPKPYAFP